MQKENPRGLIVPVQFFEREGFSQKELTQGTKNPMAGCKKMNRQKGI